MSKTSTKTIKTTIRIPVSFVESDQHKQQNCCKQVKG
jgi:hypothetical protein